MARKASISDLNCPAAQTLAVVGDRWSMLIIRNAFNGMNTFEAFRDNLEISTSVLSDLLGRLTAAGVFERVRSAEDGRSFRYRLTEKGRDLYPLVVATYAWGEKWAAHPAGPRLRLIEKATGREIRGAEVVSQDGRRLEPHEVRVEAGPGADEHVLDYVQRRWRSGGDGD